MNQNTLKNIIIGLLVVIIGLLALIYIYHSRNTSSATTSSNPYSNRFAGTIAASYPTIVKNAPPVILESPYLYDSGYWVSPDAWWMGSDAGNTYIRNNYKTNYNYYTDKHGDKHIGTTKPNINKTTTQYIVNEIQPNPMPSATIGIQNILPTGNLIAPSQDSTFPLPTLASSGNITPNPVINSIIQSPADMPNRQLPIPVMSSDTSRDSMLADSMAAKVDIQASQVIGMRGGNTHLDPVAPEITPSIPQQH